MGSIVVTPKTAEELDFLVSLLQRLGFASQVHTEEDDEAFFSVHELSESGKVFLEAKVQAALESPKPLKSWQQVSAETAVKHNLAYQLILR